MKKNKILIIIPAYNEEKSIGSVIRQIKSYNENFDIVVINDGSKDNTYKAAFCEGANVIDLPFNLGIGGAMQTGYIYASKNGYDIAVQVDADGQHDPTYLDKVIAPVMNGACDMAIGSRYVQNTSYKSTLFRRLGMIFFSSIIYLLSGEKINDTTSGFRAVNRSIIEYFAKRYPADYPEVEVLIKLHRKKYKIKEVSVEMKNREEGSSSITPIKSLYYMTKVSLSLMINCIREEG